MSMHNARYRIVSSGIVAGIVVSAATVLLLLAQQGAALAGSKAVGSLTVKIKPKDAKKDGGRWRVDGGSWQKSGKTVGNLDPGDHEVTFKNTFGWKTPKAKSVTVASGEESNTSGKYKRPSSATVNLPGNIPLELLWIPEGSFLMGSYENELDADETDEQPQHQVTFAKGFWLGKYEVTKAQWEAVMNTTPWEGMDDVSTDPSSPAVFVSWADCAAFITALSGIAKQSDKKLAPFHLPSEAQWEYACRAGTTTRYYWGDDLTYSDISPHAWWYQNSENLNEKYAHAVGGKLPNAWGLFDMIGNVAEWCEDYRVIGYSGAPTDGSAWLTFGGQVRIIRGSAFTSSYGPNLRSADRDGGGQTSVKNQAVGFRVAR